MYLMSPWSVGYTLHVIHLLYMGKNKDCISIYVSGVPLYKIIQDCVSSVSLHNFATFHLH